MDAHGTQGDDDRAARAGYDLPSLRPDEDGPTGSPDLLAVVDRLGRLAERATSARLYGKEPRRRIARLADHLARHVRPRVRTLDAPILVLLVGPTGAGKSTLLNTIAGRAVSRAGVLRPTTRELVVLARPDAGEGLLGPDGPLAGIEPDRLKLNLDDAAPEGVVVVDAPDIDSVEHGNRALTDRLVEAADLGVFVTTASRYADAVPWDVLRRIEERGLPLVVVVNRMPGDPEEQAIVLDDLRRLLASADLGGTEMDLVPVAEGATDPERDALAPAAVEPLLARLRVLAGDAGERRELASRALAGSLAGLEPHVRSIGDDVEHAAIDADRLRRQSTDAFERELGALRDELAKGAFLRAEALRRWQEFVGADELTKRFSSGIGKVRATITSMFRNAPAAPVAEVREQTLVDLKSLARMRLGEASRRAAAAWADDPAARDALDADPAAWAPSEDLDQRLDTRLEGWVDAIAADVQQTGAPKRTLARGASLGVNAAGIGVMLATFAHTGGLTGVEVGVAAATGFLNQKLLSALFGEAALVEMIARARASLMDLLGQTFREELARFDRLAPDPRALRSLAADLRAAADDLRRLPPAISGEAQPVMLREREDADVMASSVGEQGEELSLDAIDRRLR
jgi:energy-coupling factor transporter ATP-binding protein EcfA2